MEIILCILTMTIGLITGFIVGRSYEELVQAGHIPPKQPAQHATDQKFMKQYRNFLSYDGSGKGQVNIENE